jgi:hypothetical protein
MMRRSRSRSRRSRRRRVGWVKSRAAVVYGKAVPTTTTHKNSNRLSAEDRDAV